MQWQRLVNQHLYYYIIEDEKLWILRPGQEVTHINMMGKKVWHLY